MAKFWKTVLKQSQFCLFVGGISVTNSGRKNMKGHGYIARVSVTNSGRKSTSKPAELYCRATGEKIRKGSSKQAESYWEQRGGKNNKKLEKKRRNHSEEQRNRERLLSSCRRLTFVWNDPLLLKLCVRSNCWLTLKLCRRLVLLFYLLYGHLCQENWIAICLGLLLVLFLPICTRNVENRHSHQFLFLLRFVVFTLPSQIGLDSCFFQMFSIQYFILDPKTFPFFPAVAHFRAQNLLKEKPSEVRTVYNLGAAW